MIRRSTLTFCLLAFASTAQAQEARTTTVFSQNPKKAQDFTLNLNAPTDPGFVVTGASPKNVADPGNLKQFTVVKGRDIRHEARAKREAHQKRDDAPELYSEQWVCEQLEHIAELAKESGDLRTARECLNDVRSIKSIGADKQQSLPAPQGSTAQPPTIPNNINLNVLIDAVAKGEVGLPESLGAGADDHALNLVSSH